MTTATRDHWTNRFAFVLATTGAAVGLGNIWKFPYMAGDNGGSAFVIVYLLCIVLIGVPAMLAEMLIGRRGQQNPVTALHRLASEFNTTSTWQWLGWLGAVTLLLTLSFYSVVAGWSIAYLIKTWSGMLHQASASSIQLSWQQFLANPIRLLIWHGVFMIMTIWVVARGVQGGLEKASRIMMPLLFAILIILDGYAATTGQFSNAVHFLFDFKLHQLTTNVVIAAMGQAFFSLAVGAGCMLVYGSYLQHHIRLGGAVATIVVLDVLVAILVGLAIFPLVFSYHLTPEGGPGLMFKVLPIAFAKMRGGQFFGGLFFLLLLFAAWTSSISMAEPLVVLLSERYLKGKRVLAAILVGVVAWLLGIVSLLSFNVWKHVQLFHHWTIFTSITDLVTNIMLPIGGFLFVIFAGWKFPKHISQQELAFSHTWLFKIWLFLARYVAPAGIIIIFISALW